MKKLSLIVLVFVFPLLVFSQHQTVNKLFEKYAGKEGFTTVYISKNLFKMIGEMNLDDPDTDELIDKLEEYRSLEAFAMTVTRNHCLDKIRTTHTEQEMFTYFHAGGKNEIPDQGLESKIMNAVEGAEQEAVKRFAGRKKILYIVSSAAAVVAILIVSYFAFIFSPSMQDTYNNPEIAYLQAKETLFYVSAKLNEGTENLQALSEFDKATSQLSNISKIEHGTRSIYTFSLFGSGIKGLENLSRINNPFEYDD